MLWSLVPDKIKKRIGHIIILVLFIEIMLLVLAYYYGTKYAECLCPIQWG